MTQIHGPAYQIQTSRLLLRCWDPKDTTALKTTTAETLDDLKQFMPWAWKEPTTYEDTVMLLRRWRSRFDADEDYVYGIFPPDESRVLGGCGLHKRVGRDALEIGYWVHKDFSCRGLATEAAAALTRAAFEIQGVKRVEIHCHPDNLRSAAVARKLGYTMEGILRQRINIRPDELADVMIWSILDSEYSTSPSAQAQMEAFDAAGRKIL